MASESTRLTITLVQMDVALGDPERNLARGEKFVAQAAARGSTLVLFPELWTTGYALERAAELASPLGAGAFAEMAHWARRYNLWIAGSVLEQWQEGFANTAVLIAPSGEVEGVYRKVHLFRLMDEDRYLQPGHEALVWRLPWGNTAMAICYDLRFPELFRHYALNGATLILLPAEWPHPRLHHWRTLVQARAVENQCFVAACNRVGQSKGEHFCGHSMLVSPWGEVVVEAGEDEILLTATIDLNLAATVRQRIPVFQDRRPEVYDALARERTAASTGFKPASTPS